MLGASVTSPSATVAVASTGASSSAVSWPAIIGGAVAAAAVTVVLLLIGAGLGFASMSPWPNSGASATTFTIVGGIWLIVVQWVSSGIGGYLTGRLRTRWVGYHSHEVFFRDTANGFLMWALASLVGATLVASSVGSLVSGGAHAVTSIASGVAQGATQGATQGAAANPSAVSSAMDYGIDRLFRSPNPAPANTAANAAEARGEATRILANAARTGELPAADRTYLAQLIAARTGISQADAEKRIDDVVNQAKAAAAKAREVADTARKSASAVSFFTALSMLVGAFIAAAAAAYGGWGRDERD